MYRKLSPAPRHTLPYCAGSLLYIVRLLHATADTVLITSSIIIEPSGNRLLMCPLAHSACLERDQCLSHLYALEANWHRIAPIWMTSIWHMHRQTMRRIVTAVCDPTRSRVSRAARAALFRPPIIGLEFFLPSK